MSRLGPRYSLKELLWIALVVGLGLAGLRVGGIAASILVFTAIAFLMAITIIALIDRGQGQAIAIGFLVPALTYTGTVLVCGKGELDPYEGRLPTSLALQPLFAAFVEHTWFDLLTGKELAENDPAVKQHLSGGGGGGGFAGRPVGASESPDRTTFMSLGHCLFAMLFGYVGAKFGGLVFRRRASEPSA